ncbi:hypothetical protein ACS0TY_024544 [Phlomoides rotata]
MLLVAHSLKKLALFFSLLLHHKFSIPKRNNFHENQAGGPRLGFQKFQFLAGRSDLESQVLIFHAESGLLRRSNLFPYFMLVAFEAGSMIRALVLLLAHPFITLCSDDFALRVMVMISFFGLKKERFLEGSAVLPKYFLEDVGRESFEVVRRGKRKIAISDLPQVMVERFLIDYLDVDAVFGREMKVFCGYFVGLMEERRDFHVFEEMITTPNAIGVACLRKCFDSQWFSNCKEMYLVSEAERRNWHELPKELYPKPLIFHDGRLAFRPTFLATVAMFMWVPMGLTLAIVRLVVSLTFPSRIKFPILHLTGAKIRVSNPERGEVGKGVLYVCNHRTLLDPLMISYCLNTPSPLAVVVYSLSKVSEILSPIKTVRLTRNRERDSELMHELLSKGDLVVCPEGTTCREPYLLRFSPLFTEICDQVIPVATTCDVSMFYGTTARGLKCLDPLFLLMNPWPSYSIRFLDVLNVGVDLNDDAGTFRYNKANMVQDVIAKDLGFTCTTLTRKDKYLILAGNDGIVKNCLF